MKLFKRVIELSKEGNINFQNFESLGHKFCAAESCVLFTIFMIQKSFEGLFQDWMFLFHFFSAYSIYIDFSFFTRFYIIHSAIVVALFI